MTEHDRVLDAFRNCITEPKCRDCPWTECSTLDNGNVEIPRDLALAVMRELMAQEPETSDVPKSDNNVGCWYDITHNYTLEQVVSALKSQELCKDAVSRKYLLDQSYSISFQTINESDEEAYREKVVCVEDIEDAPSVQPVPVIHGRWVTNKYGEIVCSECGNNALQVLTGCLVNRHFEPHKSKFCPNCGARMDDERSSNECD